MQLSDLPTELLLKLMSYLPTHDKVTMRYVSRRFRDVSEIPSLWKEFLWLDYEPRHVCSVSSVLKVSGEYVRRIFFPNHVTQTKILEMLCYCTKVTHLCLTEKCQLSLDHTREIVCTMIHLHQLDIFADRNFVHKCPPGVSLAWPDPWIGPPRLTWGMVEDYRRRKGWGYGAAAPPDFKSTP